MLTRITPRHLLRVSAPVLAVTSLAFGAAACSDDDGDDDDIDNPVDGVDDQIDDGLDQLEDEISEEVTG